MVLAPSLVKLKKQVSDSVMGICQKYHCIALIRKQKLRKGLL